MSTLLLHSAPMLRFDLRPEDTPLLEAAIRFGDWLAAREDVTDEQRHAITSLQHVLRCLPEIAEGVRGSYLFEAVDRELYEFEGTGTPPAGVWGSWFVDYGDFRNQSNGAGISLEIGSVYSPYPDRLQDVLAGSEHEMEFYLVAGRDNRYSPRHYEAWIAEISNLASYIRPDMRCKVEADFR